MPPILGTWASTETPNVILWQHSLLHGVGGQNVRAITRTKCVQQTPLYYWQEEKTRVQSPQYIEAMRIRLKTPNQLKTPNPSQTQSNSRKIKNRPCSWPGCEAPERTSNSRNVGKQGGFVLYSLAARALTSLVGGDQNSRRTIKYD